jgi:hypothetical protein
LAVGHQAQRAVPTRASESPVRLQYFAFKSPIDRHPIVEILAFFSNHNISGLQGKIATTNGIFESKKSQFRVVKIRLFSYIISTSPHPIFDGNLI